MVLGWVRRSILPYDVHWNDKYGRRQTSCVCYCAANSARSCVVRSLVHGFAGNPSWLRPVLGLWREWLVQWASFPLRLVWGVLVESLGEKGSFSENTWIGHILTIGDDVRLNITGPCDRCVMTTLPQGDLPKDSGILRTAIQENHGTVGVYAAVEQGGMIRPGDRVRLES